MKFAILFGVLFSVLTASAAEISGSVDCIMYQGDEIKNKLDSAQSFNFTQATSPDGIREYKTVEGPHWKTAGEYEGIKLALDVVFPNKEYGDENIQVILSESSASGNSVTTLVSSTMFDKGVDFMYRKPGSNKFVVVGCGPK